jgi:hypothetical protein
VKWVDTSAGLAKAVRGQLFSSGSGTGAVSGGRGERNGGVLERWSDGFVGLQARRQPIIFRS